MPRIQRALLAASLSAVSLGTFAVPAATFAADPATAASSEYVVKAGDFLAGIAAKVGVALPDLLSVNNLTAKSVIVPGEKLVIPAGAKSDIVYTVKSGDFLARIAAQYKVTLADLLAVNEITAKTVIMPGTKLALPAGAVAPQAKSPAVAAAPAPAGLTYTVKNGDFLAGIAAQYKVKLGDLLAVNKMTAKTVIRPGNKLALPAGAVAPQAKLPAAPAAPALAGLTYTVKSGDFLGSIASKYKVKLSDLLTVNQLKATSLITPGLKIALPAGAVEPIATPVPAESTVGPAGVVVAYAYAQLGKPYRFFSAGPATFDCSGLVKAAYAQIGTVLVHHAASQATYGTAIDVWSQPIKPGDLIFMATHGDPKEINHVGIAVDATHWIHAPKPGDVVRLGPIPPKGVINAARRLIP